MKKIWILALSMMMIGGALTACGQDHSGAQAENTSEAAWAETAGEETAGEAESAFPEGVPMGGTSAEETETGSTAAETAAGATSGRTEAAAAALYDSREEAYRTFLTSLDPDEWEGAALVDFTGTRKPALFIAGKAAEQGSILVLFDRGSLHAYTLRERYPTWLRAERLLCDSAMDGRRHYDRIYSIGEASLTIIAEGHYGMAEDGDGWTYLWDGVQMNREGYRQAVGFIYDRSRAVSLQEEELRPLSEWIAGWTEDVPEGDTAAAAQADTSAAAETGGTAAAAEDADAENE